MGAWSCEEEFTTMSHGVEVLEQGAGAALGVAGGLALAGFLWKERHTLLGAVALFTRIGRDEAAEHPARRALLDAIRAAPGASVAELAAACALNLGTARYHLRVMERAGLVGSRVEGRERRFVEAGVPPAPAMPPERRRVLDAVADRPSSTLTDVARAAGIAKSTAHHHVGALVAQGRVVARREGRALRLDPAQP